MASEIKLPKDPQIAGKLIDVKSQEKGILGKVFGTPEHARNNIAAIALIALFVLLLVTMILSAIDGTDREEMTTGLLSAFTFTLGLIFGRRID